MTDDPVTRRFTAYRRCDRILSGARPQSMRERLADLVDSPYDLDRRQDFYGDGIVRELEQRVAGLLGKADAAYFPTGTMAQQAALQYWADRQGSRTVAMHPLAHPEVHERHAYARLSGLHTVWPTAERRNATGAELRAFDEHFGTLMLELPLRDAGFVLPSWGDLTDVVAAARERGAAVHFDGARLWESVHHLGHELAEVAALADSVYVSCYKTLGGVSGAVLAGDDAFVQEAKVWRHRYGGRLWQQWPAVLTALIGLDRELPRVAEYVGHAKQVAAALADVPGARVYPEPPHTHQFQLWLPHPAEALNAAGLRLAEEHGIGLFGAWWEPGLPGLAMTEVTVAAPALDWTPKEITEAMELFLSVLPG